MKLSRLFSLAALALAVLLGLGGRSEAAYTYTTNITIAGGINTPGVGATFTSANGTTYACNGAAGSGTTQRCRGHKKFATAREASTVAAGRRVPAPPSPACRRQWRAGMTQRPTGSSAAQVPSGRVAFD